MQPLRSFADGTLFGSRFGSEPATVVALHGWGRSHADFGPSMARLVSCGAAVGAVALDLPGFGASAAPAEPCGAAGYAAMVAPVFDECDERLVLIGHSFGGRVAVELAFRYADTVAALVLCGVPLLRGSNQARSRSAVRYRLIRGLAKRGWVSDDAMERMRQRFGSADYRAASGVMRDVLVRVVNETYETQLRQICQPVELVWGRDDGSVPLTVAQQACEILPDARLTVLEDVGHFVPTEAAPALVDAVVGRLNML